MCIMTNIFNGFYHMKSCLHTTHSMIRPRLPRITLEHWHTIVAVSQEFNSQTMIVLFEQNKGKSCVKLEKSFGVFSPQRFCRIERTNHSIFSQVALLMCCLPAEWIPTSGWIYIYAIWGETVVPTYLDISKQNRDVLHMVDVQFIELAFDIWIRSFVHLFANLIINNHR